MIRRKIAVVAAALLTAAGAAAATTTAATSADAAPTIATGKVRPSSDFVQRDLGHFATPQEAEAAVLEASKHPVLKKDAPTTKFAPQQCNQGEAARVCAQWSVIGTTSWNLYDEHNWNPGPYGTVGFKAKFHSGFVAPEQLANIGQTRCWYDGALSGDDTCAHNYSSDMDDWANNTFQVCVRHSVSVKSTYTQTPFAKAISNGCSF